MTSFLLVRYCVIKIGNKLLTILVFCLFLRCW